MTSLKITDFAVIIRNIVNLGKPEETLVDAEIAKELQNFLAEESEAFTVATKVTQRVCSLAQKDMMYLNLPTIRVLDHPKLYFLGNDKILELFAEKDLHDVQLHLALHKSGVLLINMHLRFCQEDMDITTAIDYARINLRPLAIKIPSQFDCTPTMVEGEDRCRLISDSQGNFLVGTLKDFCSDIIRPMFILKLQKKLGLQPLWYRSCISSTLVQIYRTQPECESIGKFVMPNMYGREILGLGALDRNYQSRSEAVVADAFTNDLSSDEEAGVYTFGLSDLIIFDNTFDTLVETTYRNKKFRHRDTAISYNTTHYSCLLEWVYLEKYIIDLYNRMLSHTIVQKDITPEKMLIIQKHSMYDLIGYKVGVTPFPSREEFWEQARIAHRIPEAQEKLEKKRDLATDYVIQEYTLRTNKSIQLVNIFISATAAFGLMEVILSIQQGENKLLWSGITLSLFAVMLVLLWGMNHVILKLSQKS